PDPPLDMIAEASRVEGCLALADDPAAARAHFERAARIYGAIGNHTARTDVLRLAGHSPSSLPPLTLAVTSTSAMVAGPGRARTGDGEPRAARLVESAAAISELATHPPLLGIETLALVGD